MLISIMFLLLLVPLILLFTIGIPIIIGVCVYKDANKRIDCNPWLWALVAALVPSCIGLIVYLIIRRDYPLKTQDFDSSGEHTYYQENYEKQAVEPQHGLPTWAKALIIIGIVVLVICIVAFLGTMAYAIFGNQYGIAYYDHF